MRFGIDIAPLGELADPILIADLGRAADAAGWDGLSIWDSLGLGMGTYAPDPFVALAGVAAATTRLRLILAVAVLGRRRPQLVAQSAATLDRLSGGRFVLGVGAGGDPGDLAAFGDSAPGAELVARMDAGLRVIEPWLRGEAARMEVPGASAEPVVVGPPPLQRPRPPIWLGGMRPGALRRAASLEGWMGVGLNEELSAMALTPDDVAARVARIRSERAALGRDGPFEVAILGRSDGIERGTLQAFEDAGLTYWLESLSPMRAPVDQLREVIAAGPAALGR
jgi:alkanesulfonate monooxygenase SsuD/methylene tetrahydromethanopterin reductase-like flavin-dependent oxidoreductase (luciferase family)